MRSDRGRSINRAENSRCSGRFNRLILSERAFAFAGCEEEPRRPFANSGAPSERQEILRRLLGTGPKRLSTQHGLSRAEMPRWHRQRSLPRTRSLSATRTLRVSDS